MEDSTTIALLFLGILLGGAINICVFHMVVDDFQTQVLSKIDPKLTEYELIEQIAAMYKENHNYSSDFNCVNFTTDMYFILNTIGVKSYVKSGAKIDLESETGRSGHVWNEVCFDLDATGGRYMKNNKIYVMKEDKYYLQEYQKR